MTEVKHTPGPWHLCQHLRDNDQCDCGYRGGIWGSDQRHMVCEIGSTVIAGEEGLEAPRYPRAVEMANARLIAAAPDLLVQLKDLVDFLESTAFTTGFLSGARAAIAKAEGK